MNLLKRLHNLWKLSALELGNTDTPKQLIVVDKQAQIIKRTNPIEEFLEKNGTE